jgi:hypothetical protein
VAARDGDRGRAALASWLRSPLVPDELRAAAAWALAGATAHELRAALEAATHDGHPAVAANARAALAASPGSASATLRLRLRDEAGAPAAPRWLIVELPGVGPVWTRTGSLGQTALAVPEGTGFAVSAAAPGVTLAADAR